MTVATTIRTQQFNANGSNTDFDFSFRYTDDSEIKVTARNTTSSELDGIAANTDSELTLTTDYTVSPTDGGSSGTVTTVATWSTGIRLTVYRVSERTQETDYIENDDFPAETHEAALDHGILISQEIGEEVERALQFPISDSAASQGELPNEDERAGNFLSFDANGVPIAAGSVTGAAVSTFMETLLDDLNAADARATLGVGNVVDLFNVTTGSSNTYALTVSATVSALVDGVVVFFEPNHTNTGAATLNVNSLGAKTIKPFNNADTTAGDLKTGIRYAAIFDETDDVWRILTPSIKLNQKGADVASATTIDLDAATGDLVDITGTTQIDAITLSEGVEKTVRFTGALTITHGASLVLPSSANITTAAGDFAVFRGYASGVVRCVTYTKADGTPVTASGEAGAKSVQVFTASGTWNRPAGITKVIMEVLGGGGGGGGVTGAASGANRGGGGGGGGGYAKKLLDVSGISSSTITVGDAGAGGTSGSAGSSGGTSSWADGTNTVSATGGTGGNGATSNNISGPGGSGGAGSGGDVNFPGSGGGSGAGVNGGVGISGMGGNSTLGGGAASASGNSNGNAANANSGGGGSGGLDHGTSTDRAGGDGGSGIVIVWGFE